VVSYLRIKTKVNSFLLIDLIKLFMTEVNEQQRDQQSSPAFRTLEQKIDELASGIRGIRDIF
jgi:hypothetical protein